jgi:hypothetical protein
MQPAGQLLDAVIEIDQRQLRVHIHCNIDEEQGIFLLPIRIIEEAGGNGIIASGELKISIVNPITIVSVVLYTVGVFGYCMIQHIAVPIYELFVQSYAETRQPDANPTMVARVRHLYERVKENINTVIEPTKKAIAPCARQAPGDVIMTLLGVKLF